MSNFEQPPDPGEACCSKIPAKVTSEPGVVVHAFNTSTLEAEAGGFLSLRTAKGYTEKPCLKKQNKKQNKTKIPE